MIIQGFSFMSWYPSRVFVHGGPPCKTESWCKEQNKTPIPSIILSPIPITMANILTIKATFSDNQVREAQIPDPNILVEEINGRVLDWKPLIVSSSFFTVECSMDGMNNYMKLDLYFDVCLINGRKTRKYTIESNGFVLIMTVATIPSTEICVADKHRLSKFSVKYMGMKMVQNFSDRMAKYVQTHKNLVLNKNRLAELKKEIKALKIKIATDQEICDKISPIQWKK